MIANLSKKLLGSTIPVVNINGIIHAQQTENVIKRLKSINTSTAVALAVSINSPGGLPVQSQIISEKIKDFSLKHNLKLYTFAKDVAASGGYFILSIGDHVVADRTSIVGSIGVVFTKYSLQGLLQHTSLENKSLASNDKLLVDILNPFSELEEADRKFIANICENSHAKFINYVKKQRGNKLKDDGKIFTGQVFTGEDALERGLIDEVGSMVQVLAKRHPEAKLDVAKQQKRLLQRLLSL